MLESYYESRLRVVTHLGGKCNHCGFSDSRALQFDHVNGGGLYHIRCHSNWRKYHTTILNDEAGMFQLLCANCNWIKRFELKEHPQKRGPSFEEKQRRSVEFKQRLDSWLERQKTLQM